MSQIKKQQQQPKQQMQFQMQQGQPRHFQLQPPLCQMSSSMPNSIWVNQEDSNLWARFCPPNGLRRLEDVFPGCCRECTCYGASLRILLGCSQKPSEFYCYDSKGIFPTLFWLSISFSFEFSALWWDHVRERFHELLLAILGPIE